MHTKNIEKYSAEYEKVLNTNDDKKRIFELSIDFLRLKDGDRPKDFCVTEKGNEIINRALNSARMFIDQLIDQNKFEEARLFCIEAKDKLSDLEMSESFKRAHNGDMENFFEMFNYRIIDREYVYNAKAKIEEIEKKSENKIYEVLTIFVTIISIIFSFVNGGAVRILQSRVPSFIALAITMIFSWWVIKAINSKMNQ